MINVNNSTNYDLFLTSALIKIVNTNPEVKNLFNQYSLIAQTQSPSINMQAFVKALSQPKQDDQQHYYLILNDKKVMINLSDETAQKVYLCVAKVFIHSQFKTDDLLPKKIERDATHEIEHLSIEKLKQFACLDENQKKQVLEAFRKLSSKESCVNYLEFLISDAPQSQSVKELVQSFYLHHYLTSEQKQSYDKLCLVNSRIHPFKMEVIHLLRNVTNESDLAQLTQLLENLDNHDLPMILYIGQFLTKVKTLKNREFLFIQTYIKTYHPPHSLSFLVKILEHRSSHPTTDFVKLFSTFSQLIQHPLIVNQFSLKNDEQAIEFLYQYIVYCDENPSHQQLLNQLLTSFSLEQQRVVLNHLYTTPIYNESHFKRFNQIVEVPNKQNIFIQLLEVFYYFDLEQDEMIHIFLNHFETITEERQQSYFLKITNLVNWKHGNFDQLDKFSEMIQQSQKIYRLLLPMISQETDDIHDEVFKFLSIGVNHSVFVKNPDTVIQSLYPLIQSLKDQQTKKEFCQLLAFMASCEDNSFFNLFLYSIDISTEEQVMKMIDLCYKLLPQLKNIKSSTNFSQLISMNIKMSSESEQSLMMLFCSLLEYQLIHQLSFLVIEDFFEASFETWEENPNLLPWLSQMTQDEELEKDFFEFIFKSYDREKFDTLLNFLSLIYPAFQDYNLSNNRIIIERNKNYLSALHQMLPKLSLDEIKQLKLLVPIFDYFKPISRTYFIAVFQSIKMEERETFFSLFLDVIPHQFSSISHPNVMMNAHLNLLRFMHLIPLNTIKKLVEILKTHSFTKENELIKQVAQENKKEIEESVNEHLHSPTINRYLIKDFFDFKDFLMISDTDRLLQEAIMADAKLSITDSPSQFYLKIKNIVDNELLLDLDQLPIAWNIKQLRLSIPVKLKQKELPTLILKQTFSQIIEQFQQRLIQLPLDQQKEIQIYFKENFLTEQDTETFEQIQTHFLNTPVISGLFIKDYQAESVLTGSQVQLYSILAALADASTLVPEGEWLTEQEMFLFKLIVSLRACRTGLLNGLESFYRGLPAKYRLGFAFNESATGTVQTFLNQAVQEGMASTFCNVDFLKALGSTLKQAVHDTEYLKNRYCKQLGFAHAPTFDLNHNAISAPLLTLDTLFFLNTFFNYFPVNRVVNKIVNDSKFLLKTNYGGFATLLEDKLPVDQSFIFEEETYVPLSLTPQAAKLLLKMNGYTQLS